MTVTLDKDMRMTGVFAGELEKVLEEAVKKIKTYVAIPVKEEFDIVLTHGGYAGRNHYQAAKAAVGALPAVKEKGSSSLLRIIAMRSPSEGPSTRP